MHTKSFQFPKNFKSGQFINSKWENGQGTALESTNPANQTQLWHGNSASTNQVDAAFQAAQKGFEIWADTPLEQRITCIERFKALAIQHKDQLGELISRETGKIWWDANGEAGIIGAKVDVSLKAYHERTGSSGFDTAFGRAHLQHRPHGVMAILGPYNFPAHLPNGQIIPALIAGNSIVYKPSEQCPAVGEFMANLYAMAGLPNGVFNMVQGGRDIGAAVLDHPLVDGVLFTGSASTGAFIHKKFAGRPEVILALEMGGNNPLVVWDVQNTPEKLKASASIIAQSAFITAGQRCTCARRLIVQSGPKGDAIIAALVEMVDNMVISADPSNADIEGFIGPIISADIASHVVARAQAIESAGGTVIRRPKIMEQGAAFISPGIIDVTGIAVDDDEIFGPVLQIIRVDNFKEAIQSANDTRFGLSAGLISDDGDLWDEFARKIRAGVVNFNRATTGASGALPFGGPGASGNHSPGAYYAADFCAWPMACQISDSIEIMPAKGLI